MLVELYQFHYLNDEQKVRSDFFCGQTNAAHKGNVTVRTFRFIALQLLQTGRSNDRPDFDMDQCFTVSTIPRLSA